MSKPLEEAVPLPNKSRKDESDTQDCRLTKKRKKTSENYHLSEDDNSERTKAEKTLIALSNSETQKTPKIPDFSSDDESQDKNRSSPEFNDTSNSDSESNASNSSSSIKSLKLNGQKKRKRNDPEIFATSMSKILSSKLSSLKRNDPVLARSAQAIYISKQATDAKLESLAKRKIRADKKDALKKGRVVDVLGTNLASENSVTSNKETTKNSSQSIMEKERKLKKIAQRGVIKLFNAVRAAQIKGEEAAREAKAIGIVSQKNKEEKINEMSKKGFLDLIVKRGEQTKLEAIKST
ncbi:Ribosomal RNA-processing protein 15 [Erysiphe necator]|nr:Ribosomal RNA-processing protein 15 [Erysiphe necator]